MIVRFRLGPRSTFMHVSSSDVDRLRTVDGDQDEGSRSCFGYASHLTVNSPAMGLEEGLTRVSISWQTLLVQAQALLRAVGVNYILG